MLLRRVLFPLALIIGLILSTHLYAQSRTDEHVKKQEEKAKNLHVYEPKGFEKNVIRIQQWGLLSATGKGIYPYLGSAYPGGGFAGGAGFRHAFADNGFFDIHGAYSIKGYKLVNASVRLPETASGRMKTFAEAEYVDADEVRFFGIGNDSDLDNETNFSYKHKTFSITETLLLSKQFHIGGSIAYLDIETGPGNSTLVPSIEEEFSPLEVPGLVADTQYTKSNFFAEFDWRQSPGYTTRGGFYRVDWYDYNERDQGIFSFHRWDVEAVQHIPMLRANQVIALRGLASFTDLDNTEQIPFFLLPKLGGGSELRGFRDFRFRDRYRMLLTAEYRWTPSKFMDMLLFYEAGKVANNKNDLDTKNLHKCYGIGARFHTPAFTVFRVELAHSVEGTRIILSGGAAF
jgi:hypothetical protein